MTEARLRNCRLLAELTKFKLCPYGTFFTLLKVFLASSILYIHADTDQLGISITMDPPIQSPKCLLLGASVRMPVCDVQGRPCGFFSRVLR